MAVCLMTRRRNVAFLMKPLNDITPVLRIPLNKRFGRTFLKFMGPGGIAGWLAIALFILGFSATSGFAQTNACAFIIIAGSSVTNGTGDGPGPLALFNNPEGAAVDTNQNLFVADTGNDTIRELVYTPTNWLVSTIAGIAGIAGSTNGPGTNALFSSPEGIAVDAKDNLYVADTLNNTIRQLTLAGTNWSVITIGGQVGNAGSSDGTNGTAQFFAPQGIAIDAHTNLYVADTTNGTIRRMTLVNTNWVVTTIAGLAGTNGSGDGSNTLAQFSHPEGITVDAHTNLYVADTGNGTIRKIILKGTNWVVTTIAGKPGIFGTNDGVGTNAQFNLPGGLTVDASSNLFVGDTGNQTIRKLTWNGTNWVVTTIGGLPGVAGHAGGYGDNSRFTNPKGISVDSLGHIFVADDGGSPGSTIFSSAISGGVPIVNGSGQSYSGLITVILGPIAASNSCGAWGVIPFQGSLPEIPMTNYAYTESFPYGSSLVFSNISGWSLPTNQTVLTPPYVANLNYVAWSPVLSTTNGLGIMGTPNTLYTIQYATNLAPAIIHWMPLPSITKPSLSYTSPPLAAGFNQILPAPVVGKAPPTNVFYRAVWTGQ